MTEENQNSLLKAKKIKENKYQEYLDARKAFNDLCSKSIKDLYCGKYIKWTESYTENSPHYMYVYSIWNSSDEKIYFEGVYFHCVISEYADYTWFDWTQFSQRDFNLYDFNDETGEYNSNSGKMSIISREEFFEAFHEATEKMIKEHQEFEYEIK